MKIYLSASTQEWNKTVNNMTEEALMFDLRDRTYELLKSNTSLTLFKNTNKDMSLSEIVSDSNNKKSDFHFSFHSNAGGGSGPECWYYTGSKTGEQMATKWLESIERLRLKSRGVKHNKTFYELKRTYCPAALMEFFFHDNRSDIAYYLKNIDKYAIYAAMGIAKACNVPYEEGVSYDYLPDLKKVSPVYHNIWRAHFNKYTSLNWNGLFINWKNAAKKGVI